MSFEKIFLKQKITYWQKTAVDGFNDETFAAPVTINARWEDRATTVLSADGVEVLSRSRVYLAQDISTGDFLMNGISTITDPRTLNAANRVINFRKVPDLTATNFERRAFV